jgi:hypothetical protein
MKIHNTSKTVVMLGPLTTHPSFIISFIHDLYTLRVTSTCFIKEHKKKGNSVFLYKKKPIQLCPVTREITYLVFTAHTLQLTCKKALERVWASQFGLLPPAAGFGSERCGLQLMLLNIPKAILNSSRQGTFL